MQDFHVLTHPSDIQNISPCGGIFCFVPEFMTHHWDWKSERAHLKGQLLRGPSLVAHTDRSLQI